MLINCLDVKNLSLDLKVRFGFNYALVPYYSPHSGGHMGTLSLEDRRTYEYLLRLQILRRVLPDKLNAQKFRKGLMLTCCSDGDQFEDVYTHIVKVCLQHMPWPRVHLLPRMGGALVIPHGLGREHYGPQLVEDILTTYKLKDIETLALYAHAPCGAAKAANLNLAQVLDLLAKAKFHMKQEIKKNKIPLDVVCFVHIDSGAGGKHTYHFPVAQWQLATARMPVIPGHAWPPENVHVELTANSSSAEI